MAPCLLRKLFARIFFGFILFFSILRDRYQGTKLDKYIRDAGRQKTCKPLGWEGRTLNLFRSSEGDRHISSVDNIFNMDIPV